MRKVSLALALALLAACNRGNQDKEAVRKAVQDRLAGMGMPPSTVDVQVKSVDFKGDQATADISVIPKSNAGAAMGLRYNLQYKENKWAVTGRADSSHGGGAAMPGGAPGDGVPANPHGGGAMPGAGAPGGAMPSPEDLPPAGKKPGKQQ